ncbi:hypothetical protein CO180_02470 [candidate division WWE3 bacterium CG_4_9_14_3_um_filter_41_6]|uniref:Cohesin domain-containing protein n=1 Tax=candidate division WWE3 bacterium CG_4_10_14_0_2_um_filter_41_14 TaxID=1975072 RepID=A0A2M7TIK3_UNCKA|nr:MAG: hypothetical protein COY32_03855 [candidate division WWE3 bacterium CG_4_10_14_0_2_um_filter_41_14]PJA38795.1 MAG: hypothetical protein CO180_02470 [candidate division WWE3 bacterium CG_4_9_14_3_um_filter_41_6]
MKFWVLALISTILFFALPKDVLAQQAILSLSPSTITVQKGQTISATVILNTENDTIDRVLAKITYTSGILAPQSIATSNSFITIWYTVDTSSTASELILEGGVSGNGVSGSNLTLATINFVTRADGVATVAFASDSAVYLSGTSTNILVQSQSATYIVGSTPTASVTPSPTISGTTTPTPMPLPATLPVGGTEQYSLMIAIGFSFVVVYGLFLVLKK